MSELVINFGPYAADTGAAMGQKAIPLSTPSTCFPVPSTAKNARPPGPRQPRKSAKKAQR